MLLKVDLESRLAARVPGQRLNAFGLDERGLQDVLFRSLDRLLPDDELLLVAQSRQWQEEPDLMALDKEGNLYIFELKAWESRSENLLQALRYGQIYGIYGYEDLNRLYSKFDTSSHDLASAHRARFYVELDPDGFNQRQVFVVMTNGLDYKTREASKYWRDQGLDVRPWVYRAYEYEGIDNKMLLELSPFAVEDDPYEDVMGGYYLLNTNIRRSPASHEDMLANEKAAAYSTPWKFKIERLNRGDVVFLYQSGRGIVAIGIASGTLDKREEEYSMKLNRFYLLANPISAAEVKEVTGNNYSFQGTMFSLGDEGGQRLHQHIVSRGR